MAGYIGSKSSVTQVDGYNRTEADAEFVNDPNTVINVVGSDVGINTSAPSKNFEVRSSGSTTISVSSSGATTLFRGFAVNEGSTEYASLKQRFDSGEVRLTAGLDGWGGYTTLYTNGLERVRVDSAGRVTMPYQPAFYASIDYDDGGYVTNYDYTWLNRGSHFNATTGLFTAPVAGVYVFAATIMAGADAAYAWWRFSINGASTGGVHHTHTNSSESYRTLSGSAVFQLSQNDTVGVYMGANTAYSSGPNPWSSFSGYLIG